MLFTSELANQCVQKALFIGVVYSHAGCLYLTGTLFVLYCEQLAHTTDITLVRDNEMALGKEAWGVLYRLHIKRFLRVHNLGNL